MSYTPRNNQILSWLRKAGIKAPYADMTEAQIEEKNKLNPLSGYGFTSAAEKAQKAQQQAMFQQQLEAEQQMMQQQLLSRMSSQQQIGYHAGNGIQGLLGMLRKKDNGTGMEEGPPKDDPEVARFNELASQVGPETAKEILAQELNNPAMMTDAKQERMKSDKAKLEMENLQGQVDERKAKGNNTILAQFTGPNGEPMQRTLEIKGKDKDGNNIYKEVGRAVKGSVSDTKEGWGMTGTQKGKQLDDYEGALTAAENYLDSSDRIIDIAKQAKTGPGFASALASKANDMRFGFEGIKKIVSSQLDAKAKAKLAASDPVGQYQGVFDNIREAAHLDANVQALLLEQAYLKATANGQRATDKDIELALKTLGGKLNDPEAFAKVIQQDREVTVDRLTNMSKNTGGPNGKSLGEVYADRLKKITDRRNPNTKTVKMKKGDKTYNIPEDKAEAAEAAGYTRG